MCSLLAGIETLNGLGSFLTTQRVKPRGLPAMKRRRLSFWHLAARAVPLAYNYVALVNRYLHFPGSWIHPRTEKRSSCGSDVALGVFDEEIAGRRRSLFDRDDDIAEEFEDARIAKLYTRVRL